MNAIQDIRLCSFPLSRVPRKMIRFLIKDRELGNDGTVHLFSLMSLYSYANFRTYRRIIDGITYIAGPGEWVCRISSLRRMLRVGSREEALNLLNRFSDGGFLSYETFEENPEVIRYKISGWENSCPWLEYNYYSYKKTGFFFFPIPKARELGAECVKKEKAVYSELDAAADLWLYMVINDLSVPLSINNPVVHYLGQRNPGMITYSFLARHWGWSRSRTVRFLEKLEKKEIIRKKSIRHKGTIITFSRYSEWT